jgi:membrane associated rhomboid family serine protease
LGFVRISLDRCAVCADFAAVDDDHAMIVVRSEPRAMEYALVLASQDIETTILPEAERWQLLIPHHDLERARAALRLYVRENRPVRPAPTTAETPPLFFDVRACGWALFLCLTYFLSGVYPGLRETWRMDAGAVLQGEWYRLLTATFLHADIGHLAANLALGMMLVGFAMAVYGALPAVVALLAAGIAGNLAVLWLHGPPYYSLGASGAVMGALGLLSAYPLGTPGLLRPMRLLGRSLMAGLMLLVLTGFNPGTDVLAHVGGFVGGCLAGMGLGVRSRWQRSERIG